jgi:hypothetical protein
MTPLIQKFRDKRQGLLDDVHIAFDSINMGVNLEQMSSDLIDGLSDKAPIVRKNIFNMMERIIRKTYVDVL